MKLQEAMDIETGEAAAFVGAGGKTTAIWRLLHEMGGPAVFTTTTKIMEPALPHDGALMLSPQPDPARARDLLARTPRLVLAASRLPGDYPPAPGHPIPSLPHKLAGLAPDVLDKLIVSCSLPLAPCPAWLIEADGAKGAGLKIPGEHEPVIPTRVDCVVVCAHLDVIGQPVSETTVHRLIQAEVLGLRPGQPISSKDVVHVLADPRAGLKGIPRGARTVALLTQRNPTTLHPEAITLCEQLVATGKFDRVVVAALRAEQPVLLTRPFGVLKPKGSIAVVVLAAGASTRMGQPKQLLDWGGKPLVRHVVDQVLGGQDGILPHRVIVVLGSHADQVRAALEGSDVRLVVNAEWERGLSASLCAGLAAVPADVAAVVFVHADQPNVTPQLLAALATRFHETGAPIVVPVYHGQRSTPTLFARELFDELAHVSGDEGGRSLIFKHADRVAVVEADDPHTLADIDTIQDYAAMQISDFKFPISNPKPATSNRPSGESVTSNQQPVTSSLRNIRGLISDMDGVLWRGVQPMPGLIDFFAFLRRAGIRFVLATNNASRASQDYVERLASLGVQVSRAEILCAAEATAEYLAATRPGAGVFVVGEPPLVNALAERGLAIAPKDAAQAHCVVVGWDRNLTWEKLARATQLIRGGAQFIGTNPDRTWPSEDGLLPGNGANLAFLQAATDVEPLIIGKPGKAMFDQAIARLGMDTSAIAMLGDRLETDIEGGHRAGLTTIFVCSGVSTREEAEHYAAGPDLIFEDIAALTRVWENEISN